MWTDGQTYDLTKSVVVDDWIKKDFCFQEQKKNHNIISFLG